MKPKNLFLLSIFIFGLFLFLLPNFAEAACPIYCGYPQSSPSNCKWSFWKDVRSPDECGTPCYSSDARDNWERIGIIGDIAYETLGFNCSHCLKNCSTGSSKCSQAVFPSGSNKQSCTARDQCGLSCSDFSKTGVWDAFESKCVTCDGQKENRILGYSTKGKCADGNTKYGVCAHCGNKEGDAGNGKCESACGAAAACDEKAVGASCGTGGTCNSSCQCIIVPCDCTSTTIGGCCDGCNYCPAGTVFNGTSCVDSTQTIYCGVSCTGGADSGCTFTALECAAGGSCGTAGTAQNIPADKVCTGNALGDPSTTNYCDYAENCTKGDCSATKYYRACAGTGSCRTNNTGAATETVIAANGKVLGSACGQYSASLTYYCNIYNSCTNGACVGHQYYRACNGSGSCRTDNTYAYDKTVYASAGYSLTSTCGKTGSTLCDSTWRASSGTGDNHYGKGGAYNCQGMCDGSGLCEYAVNCEGICTGTLTVSISGSGTCTVTASLTASNCDGQSWQVKDDGTTKCSGTVSGSSYSKTCSSWTVGVGSYTYNLYIGGVKKDSDSVSCSETPNNPPTCNSLAASPTSGNAPLAVIFTGSGSDTDGTIVAYQWDFNGDGTWDQTTTVNNTGYTYSIPSSYTARLRVQDDDGAWSSTPSACTKTISVSEAGVAINPPSVTTNAANPVGTTSATLNGYLNSLGYDPATCPSCSCIVWFKWGPTPAMANSTPVQTKTSTGSFSANISGLIAGQTYYFEAFARNGGSW